MESLNLSLLPLLDDDKKKIKILYMENYLPFCAPLSSAGFPAIYLDN